MKLSDRGELDLVSYLKKRFPPAGKDVLIGIGDDCAVVESRGDKILYTTDMMVENLHFDLRWTTPFQIGFKLVSVNVSDICSMGGAPDYLLLNFAASGDTEYDVFKGVVNGIAYALDLYDMTLIGGDMSSSERLVLSATVCGRTERAVTRRGARPGDGIFVSGFLGDAACGLNLMRKIGKPVEIEKRKRAEIDMDWKTILPLLKRHLMPEAVNPGFFAGRATAMMDISDGLFIDLSRLCRESGVGALVRTSDIPLSPSIKYASEFLGVDPLDFACRGGDDYQLLFTSSSDSVEGAVRIGEVASSGMFVEDASGRRRKMRAEGYAHFSR